MPGKRIPDLPAIAGASTANDDNLVIFDTDAGTTKRILRSQLAAGLVGDLPYTPSGGISATTIPTAIAELATVVTAKQDKLVSGTNIKTVNGTSLLGAGDIAISGSATDHGALTGLADDDHPQYYNQVRGDARYSQIDHTHTANKISDSTSVGRSVLTAVDAAAARSAIGAGTGNGDVTLTGTQTLTNKTLNSPVINGGTINNAVIGGTTRAAGNFTMLNASNNVVLCSAGGDVAIGSTVRIPGAFGDYGVLHVATADLTRQFLQSYSDNPHATVMELGKSRNATIGSHTVLQFGDLIGEVRFAGSDGGAFRAAASIQCVVDGTPGTNDMPGRLVFLTTADGASAPSVRMRIDNAGNVLVTSITGGLGYGTNAGGMVAQSTSKSTAVTLNRPTGRITMNNEALGAGASVVFRMSNSLIAGTDLVLVNAVGNNSYRVETASVSTGFVDIRVTNTTGGSLSDALLINFAIIKGAIS